MKKKAVSLGVFNDVKAKTLYFAAKRTVTVYTKDPYSSPILIYIAGSGLLKRAKERHDLILAQCAAVGFCACLVSLPKQKIPDLNALKADIFKQIRYLRECSDDFGGSFDKPVVLCADSVCAPLSLALFNDPERDFEVNGTAFFSPVFVFDNLRGVIQKQAGILNSLPGNIKKLPPTFLCHSVSDGISDGQSDQFANLLDKFDIVVQELRAFPKECQSNYHLGNTMRADYSRKFFARFLIDVKNGDVIRKYCEI